MAANNNNNNEADMTTDNTAPAPAKRVDNRLTQAQNEAVVLRALHKFGFLLGRQVAALGWPGSSTPRQAQRTLDNLRTRRLVLRQYTPTGGSVYCLTVAGAAHLRAAYGIEAAPGTNLLKRLFHHHEHRAIANDVCIWWQLKGQGGFNTEHEIAHGKAVVTKVPALLGEVKGKIPDALLLLTPSEDGAPTPVFWVEAESKRKKGPEMKHMVSMLAHMLAGYGRNRFELDLKGHEVHFAVIACPDVLHERQVARTVLALAATAAYSVRALLERICIWRPPGEMMPLEAWLLENPDVRDEFKDGRTLWPHMPKPPAPAATK
jgi:hypothetical protein